MRFFRLDPSLAMSGGESDRGAAARAHDGRDVLVYSKTMPVEGWAIAVTYPYTATPVEKPDGSVSVTFGQDATRAFAVHASELRQTAPEDLEDCVA